MYNTGRIIKNAFRISKVRGESAIRIRVPGGDMDAQHLLTIRELAQKFGNGTVHLTTRQGYEIPGIKLSSLPAARKHMAPMIEEIEKKCGANLENPEKGYPEAGTRNVCACIGNRVCQHANSDTTALAKKIESVIYPNELHLKVAITGCPNDCIKAHVQDIGIISNVTPEYDSEKCILCVNCIKSCSQKASSSLTVSNYAISRNEETCLKCGECILQCPTSALTRKKQLFRIIIGGRTGKKNPRLAGTFIEDASFETVIAVCRNVYPYINKYINRTLHKEHFGYILDRTTYAVFRKEALAGVSLNPEAKVAETLFGAGYSKTFHTECLPDEKTRRAMNS